MLSAMGGGRQNENPSQVLCVPVAKLQSLIRSAVYTAILIIEGHFKQLNVTELLIGSSTVRIDTAAAKEKNHNLHETSFKNKTASGGYFLCYDSVATEQPKNVSAKSFFIGQGKA